MYAEIYFALRFLKLVIFERQLLSWNLVYKFTPVNILYPGCDPDDSYVVMGYMADMVMVMYLFLVWSVKNDSTLKDVKNFLEESIYLALGRAFFIHPEGAEDRSSCFIGANPTGDDVTARIAFLESVKTFMFPFLVSYHFSMVPEQRDTAMVVTMLYKMSFYGIDSKVLSAHYCLFFSVVLGHIYRDNMYGFADCYHFLMYSAKKLCINIIRALDIYVKRIWELCLERMLQLGMLISILGASKPWLLYVYSVLSALACYLLPGFYMKSCALMACGLVIIASCCILDAKESHRGAYVSEESTCVVCKAAERTHILVPCGHFVLCGSCAVRPELGNICPLDKKTFTAALRVYN